MRRVLYIEDCEADVVLLRRGLECAGVRVDAVSTIAEGVAALHAVAYDAVAVDLGLEDAVSDHDSVVRVRAVVPPRMPVIVVSGSTDDYVARAATAAGANAYVSKSSPTMGPDMALLLERWWDLGSRTFDELMESVR